MIDIAKRAESALPGHPNAASIMATVAPVLVAAVTDEVRTGIEVCQHFGPCVMRGERCVRQEDAAVLRLTLGRHLDALDAAAGVVR